MNSSYWYLTAATGVIAVVAGVLILSPAFDRETVSSSHVIDMAGTTTVDDQAQQQQWRRAMEAEILELRRQLAAVNKKNQLTSEPLSTRAAQETIAATQPETEPDYDELDEQIANAAEETVQIVSGLTNNFLLQNRDDVWATSAETEIYDLFAAEGPASPNMIDAECRATLCVIDSSHDNDEAQSQFIDDFSMKLSFASAGYFTTEVDESGMFNTTFFVARDGYSLPTE